VSPELLQAAISDRCGDYHYHSVQPNFFSIKSYSLKLAGYKNRREQTTVVL
jgi:hypothetical protein